MTEMERRTLINIATNLERQRTWSAIQKAERIWKLLNEQKEREKK